MTTPQTAAAVTLPAAELDRRFYAFVIDRLIGWGLIGGASYLAWRLYLDDDRVGLGVGVIAGAVGVVSLIFAVLLGLAGVSPGKALVGLRVVGDDSGRPIGVPRALLRTAVLGVFTLPTAGLGLATLAWTAVMDPSARRRGGHDRMSNAVVVDVRPAPEPLVEDDARPRQIVNLTAMRLMPAPPRDSTPPPVPAPPAASTSPHAPAAEPRPPLVEPRPPLVEPRPPMVEPRPPMAEPVETLAPPSATAAPLAGPTPAGPRPLSAPVTPAGGPWPAPPPDRPARPAPADPSASGRRAAGPSDGPTRRPGGPAVRWRVAFDTGEEFVVEGLALVGRGPEPRPGEPVRHLVPLRSADMSVSKTHAQFQVVPDGALVVMDRGSTNGSVVVRGGVAKSLTAGRPATLLDGDTVRFGDRSMSVTREP